MAMLTNDGAISKKNPEGYMDLTAHDALTKVLSERPAEQQQTELRCSKLVKGIKIMVELAGFEIVGRVELKDTSTGRVFR